VSTFKHQISGSKGGKGGGGGGGGVEDPNTLRSRQTARVLDLIGEGPMEGLVDGLKSIILDGVPAQNPDGTYNFASGLVHGVTGTQAQDPILGFPEQESETNVGLKVAKAYPITRTIVNPDVTRCRLTVSVPALSETDTNNANTKGSKVNFKIEVQSAGGGFKLLQDCEIAGKTMSQYQRAYVFFLPGNPPWDIRVTRVTDDAPKATIQNDLFWSSYTEIMDYQLSYPNSALVGCVIDAKYFQSIPKRAYHVKGMHVRYPSNYNPTTRAYTGVWDGRFSFGYCNNPAWVFYDILLSTRYGLGEFITEAQVDKWSLYSVAKWCDELVPDGRGNTEPRWTCNGVFNSQAEAFDFLQGIASIFRGFAYWSGGQITVVCDEPKAPAGIYTNANVIEGIFNYQGGDIRSRHNVCHVTWNDPKNLGERRICYVEDRDGIARYGVQPIEINAIGCTSEGQARRIGRWTLYTEQYESEVISFKTNLQGAWARPGDIIEVADVHISGDRRGGRIVSAAGRTIVLDDAVTFVAGQNYALSCIIANGTVESRPVFSIDAAGTTVTLQTAFSSDPLPNTVWVLSASDLKPTTWRVTGVKENDNLIYEIQGVRHNPSKWGYIEKGDPLEEPVISNIKPFPEMPKDPKVREDLQLLSVEMVGVHCVVSWVGDAYEYVLQWQRENGVTYSIQTHETSAAFDTEEGMHNFRLWAVNRIGNPSPVLTFKHNVIGRLAPPACPTNLGLQIISDIGLFKWDKTPDLDVSIGGSYEMRYSPRTTGATWVSSTTLLPSIPGSATSVEVPFRPGTYFLRAIDSSGHYSECPDGASIISDYVSPSTTEFGKICDSPNFIGTHKGTVVKLPHQDWLTIDTSAAGQDFIDSWRNVDLHDFWDDNLSVPELGAGPHHGEYILNSMTVLPKAYNVRLAVDMVANPFLDSNDSFIDARLLKVDDWAMWDDTYNGAGTVQIYVSKTVDDPSSPTAVWGPWEPFQTGDYFGRGFRYMAVLDAPHGENIGIETLCVQTELIRKIDNAQNVPYIGSKMHVTFTSEFIRPPSVAISLENAATGDFWTLTNKTEKGFDIEFFTAAGAAPAGRRFDWIATGY
jgi:predicted phage tail protein